MSDMTTMACPACREIGKDTDGDNLSVFASSKFHCISAGKDKAHNLRIIQLRPELGSKESDQSIRRSFDRSTSPKPKTPFAWPNLEVGDDSDFDQLATLRNVSVDALKTMSDRGLLRFSTFKGLRAWVGVDGLMKNAQARLLSGEKWAGLDCVNRSPRSDSGAIHRWPIGITAAAEFRPIAFVEGLPDFISVLHHAACKGLEGQIAQVMLPGAAVSIHEDALPLFKGKRVRIFVHNDNRGAEAFARWSRQLQSVGAVVDGFAFDGLIQSNGKPAKDLNDLCRIGVDSWEEHRDAIESCMDFAMEDLCPV